MKQRSNEQFYLNSFPRVRMRRNRMSEFSRRIISENNLSVNDLIYPIFITYGSKVKEKIKFYAWNLSIFFRSTSQRN